MRWDDYTDVNAGMVARAGHFTSGFWEFQSNPMGAVNRRALQDASYSGRPPVEWFLFGVVRPRWVVYNALLQGQLRDSDVRLDWADVRHGVVEFETGASVRLNLPASQTVDITAVYPAGRTAEFTGPNARTHTWASVFLTWTGW